MRIKTTDGEVNVTPQGQGTLNTVLGAIGTANALMQGGNLLGLGGNNRQPRDEGDRPVTRYEMGLILESVKKDTELAELRAMKHSDDKLNESERRQADINREQAVYNGVNTATVKCIQGQVAELLGMTQLVIPNRNVAPGWGAVAVEQVYAPTSTQSGSTTTTPTQQGQ